MSTQLSTQWVCRSVPAGQAGIMIGDDEAASWVPAPVPGTVATALAAAGRLDAAGDLHARDHWYRREAALPEGARVEFGGLATHAEIWMDGELAAISESMFIPLTVVVPPGGAQRLDLCFRALRPRLRRRLPGRRARWRSRLVSDDNLRGHRTTLLGHMPNWSGDTAVIGPFRPIVVHEPVAGAPLVTRVDLRTRLLPDGTGLVSARLDGVGLAGRAGLIAVAGHEIALTSAGDTMHADVNIPAPALWWPHTHGAPATYAVTAEIGNCHIELGRIGFRTIDRRDPEVGFGLLVNGVPVFSRGAIWTGLDPTGLQPGAERLRSTLEAVQQAGFNMLRVTGMTVYETPEFFALCDELGIMVWHDFMFARFDYPEDPDFRARVENEAHAFLDGVQAHPSLAVLCGGTEVLQAASMAGCPPELWQMPLFEEILAQHAGALRPDVPYVPHAPWTGSAGDGCLPFAAAAPIAHYFGVGAYQRPLDDLASAGVRFAAECLAFANPPAPATDRALAALRRNVARDADAAWDFGDVRDHYLQQLFEVSASSLRRQDPDAWMALGRVTVAIVMQQALTAWRTDGACAGALVLMLQDVVPGVGWGIVGHDGRPKSAWHALRAVCQPVQVLLRDRVHNGVSLHAINETATPRHVSLGLRALSPDGTAEPLGSTTFKLSPRSNRTVPATALLDRWRDLTNAWRFGPPCFTVLGATLADAATGERLSEATHFPVGPALAPTRPKLSAHLASEAGEWSVHISTEGFAQFVEIDDDDSVPADNYFHLWPGESRVVPLRQLNRRNAAPTGSVRALNAHRPVHYGYAA